MKSDVNPSTRDGGAVAELQQRLHAAFADQRKEYPPDDWPEESDHISFLIVAVEILRMAVLEIGYRLHRPVDRPLRKKLYRKGEFLHAALVQKNPLAFADELKEPQPATVVYSFDAELGNDPEALADLAAKLFALKDQDRTGMPEEVGSIAWRLYHEMCPNPRQPVPESMGAAPGTWLADVTVHPRARFTSLAVRG